MSLLASWRIHATAAKSTATAAPTAAIFQVLNILLFLLRKLSPSGKVDFSEDPSARASLDIGRALFYLEAFSALILARIISSHVSFVLYPASASRNVS